MNRKKCPICGEALENSESDCCAAVNAGKWEWADEQEAPVEEEVVEEAPAKEPKKEKPAKKPKKKTTPKKKAAKKA